MDLLGDRALYRLFETRGFQRDLDDLPRDLRKRLCSKMSAVVYPCLAREPHFGPAIRKLRDWEPEAWRYRIGAWRVFYQIDEREKIVFMVALHARKDAYRR